MAELKHRMKTIKFSMYIGSLIEKHPVYRYPHVTVLTYILGRQKWLKSQIRVSSIFMLCTQ